MSEVVNIFTSKEMENTVVPNMVSREFYEWLFFQ